MNMASKATRGKVWSEKETKLLLTLWSEETIQIALDNSKCTKDTNRVYRNLLMQMQENGYKDLTLEQIVNKMKKMRQKYKTEKDKTRKTGNSKKKKWKYFDQIDNFMSQKHNVTPVAIVDTMDQFDEENESAIVENLVDKYGKGENFVKKCQTCDYEQVIHTSGVHTSVGGSLMVYSEEDEFSCPNCDFEASLEVGNPKPDEDDDNVTDEKKEAKNMPKIPKEGKSMPKLGGSLGVGNPKPDEDDENVTNEEKEAKNMPKIPKGGKNMPKLGLGSKKRKSGVEKSLDLVFEKFQQANSEDFERYRKLEEVRLEKEHNFLREQAMLESECRKQEREHELKMLSLMMGNVSQFNHLGPNLHAVYHANPNQHNIVTEEEKTFFQF